MTDELARLRQENLKLQAKIASLEFQMEYSITYKLTLEAVRPAPRLRAALPNGRTLEISLYREDETLGQWLRLVIGQGATAIHVCLRTQPERAL
jgi:hypothetical protein